MEGSTIIAIILIVVGLAVVFISFIFSEKYAHKEIDKQDNMSKHIEKQEKEINDFTNKKMAAINEYYSFVIEEIEKKHKELLFLYHMISEKDNDLQKGILNVGNIMNEFVVEKEKFSKQNEIQSTSQAAEFYNVLGDKSNKENKGIKENKGNKENKTYKETKVNKEINKQFASDGNENKSNNTVVAEEANKISNNDIILDLYAQGASVKEIASKLGLGIGEVKLVIDLFSEVRL